MDHMTPNEVERITQDMQEHLLKALDTYDPGVPVPAEMRAMMAATAHAAVAYAVIRPHSPDHGSAIAFVQTIVGGLEED